MIDKEEIDWGTRMDENFFDYIQRLDNQVETIRQEGKEPPISVIMNIMEQVTSHPDSEKMKSLYFPLKAVLKREPTMGDLLNLLSYIKARLERKVEKLESIKQLLIT